MGRDVQGHGDAAVLQQFPHDLGVRSKVKAVRRPRQLALGGRIALFVGKNTLVSATYYVGKVRLMALKSALSSPDVPIRERLYFVRNTRSRTLKSVLRTT